MRTKYRDYYTVSKYTVRKESIDTDMYDYLSKMVSELKAMKTAHEALINTPDMIGYSLGKTIEYCERMMKEIEMRASGKLE